MSEYTCIAAGRLARGCELEPLRLLRRLDGSERQARHLLASRELLIGRHTYVCVCVRVCVCVCVDFSLYQYNHRHSNQ